jgi:hypothetical protein
MRYNSAKGFIFIAAMTLVIVLGAISLISGLYVASGIIGLVVILFLWIWFDTYYEIKGNELFYKSAFIKGSINIDSIYEITRDKTMYVGLKPALALKGLIIRYNKYDDIYLSPKDADGFIEALRQINPAINIVI